MGALGICPCAKMPAGKMGNSLAARFFFQQIEQLLRALGQGLVVIQPLRVTAEAPPVVDGLAAGTAVPGALEDGTDDADIEHFPLPDRQRHRLDAAIRHPAAQAVFPGAAGGLKGAAGVEQLDIRAVGEIQRFPRLLQAGPAQQDMAVGPHGAQAPGKSIDGRRHTINGVGRHIAHPVGQIQDTRQHSQQVVGLIGAGGNRCAPADGARSGSSSGTGSWGAGPPP